MAKILVPYQVDRLIAPTIPHLMPAETWPSQTVRMDLLVAHSAALDKLKAFRTDISMKAKEILRWAIVLGSGGLGLYVLGDAVPNMTRDVVRGDISSVVFGLLLLAILAGPPLTLSYLVFRRQYRPIAAVLIAMAALFVFTKVLRLVTESGVMEYVMRAPLENHSGPSGLALSFFCLLVSLLCLLAPFYAAGWIFRRGKKLIERCLPEAAREERTV